MLGGHHACPGRVFAKRIMLLSCTSLAHMFDIEIMAEEEALEFGSPRFGFGVRKPVGKVPFRIRTRRNDDCIALAFAYSCEYADSPRWCQLLI